MSNPLVTFPDPEVAVIDYLTGAWAGRIETFKPTSVTVGYPKSSSYHVQVALEVGDPADYPVTERAQVRVTCWAPKGRRSDVMALASLTQGLLYNHPGDFDVAGVTIPIGRSDVVEDPDTGYLMCWFLVRVSLKATVLATS